MNVINQQSASLNKVHFHTRYSKAYKIAVLFKMKDFL